MISLRSSPKVKTYEFSVSTRLRRSTGNGSSRYALEAVRVLPTAKKDVVIQATDGHQAVSVKCPTLTSCPPRCYPRDNSTAMH